MASRDRIYRYNIFGTVISSSIPLSGLGSASLDGNGESEAEIVVVQRDALRGTADPSGDGTEVYTDPSQGLRIHRLDDGFALQHHDIGRLRTGANRIAVSPEETADRKDIEWLVTNLGLRLVFIQRGNVVFHASGVVVDESLVAFTGPSGRGKSTLAAACYAADHTHHSDDLVPIVLSEPGEKRLVPPGPARMRVNDDVNRALQLSPPGRTPGDAKSIIDTSNRHSSSPRELDVLYVIEGGDEIAIEQLSTHDAVFEILRRSYALYRNSDSESSGEHLNACGTVARSVDVRRLSRPRSFQHLDRLVAAIERDVSG